jgi:hypothetical protein
VSTPLKDVKVGLPKVKTMIGEEYFVTEQEMIRMFGIDDELKLANTAAFPTSVIEQQGWFAVPFHKVTAEYLIGKARDAGITVNIGVADATVRNKLLRDRGQGSWSLVGRTPVLAEKVHHELNGCYHGSLKLADSLATIFWLANKGITPSGICTTGFCAAVGQGHNDATFYITVNGKTVTITDRVPSAGQRRLQAAYAVTPM